MNKLNGSLHRLFIEDVNRGALIDLVSSYFDGFSVREQIGYWQGQAEKSLLIEVITDKTAAVYELAGKIKALNCQESVLVEIVSNSAYFV